MTSGARRQLTIVGIVLAVIVITLYAGERVLHTEIFPVVVGTRAPDFQAFTLDSVPRVKSLADFHGQVVLLNFWATWCEPCRVEMPSIERLHEQYGPKGLKIVAVSIDEPGTDAQIRAFVREFGLKFEILHDPQNRITDDYDLGGYPETFVLGRDGIIRKMMMQVTNWDSPENRALIARLLTEKAE
jgi:cytochrome c biogenesis protein CcmG/thiol:disulfide interchange protein DsbE